ncbi:type II toxin-antitoxin system VapC family toxin [bacterium]|nr:type II toxin-antitoxin system VapC family toxin [bacterium]
MIYSSNSDMKRGLDTMIIVYSLLDDHPASTVCEQFIRTQTGWFTTTLTLFEVKAVLTKIYAVETILVTRKIELFAPGPIAVVEIDLSTAIASMKLADAFRIDMTDAVFLHTSQTIGASELATDDNLLAQVCKQIGITPETPIDSELRKHLAKWEDENLPMKGLPRILRNIHHWLSQNDLRIAQDFWSQTGGGSHLP